MAGEWLKFEANTPEKQEVFSITVSMGWEDPDLTVGKLLKVWRWFDQQTIDGNASRVTLALLDKIIGVSGFAKAMCDVGWLICVEQGISLPNFDRHNGKTAKDRCLTARRVAKHKSNDKGNGESVSAPLPREEKRREDLKASNTNVLDVGDKIAKPPGVDCPHKDIISVYHEVLPMCPEVREWTPARATQLRARWNESTSRQNLDYWRTFFEYVKSCSFLVGHQPDQKRRPFFADLEWITKSANFTKIREGKYERSK
jgi:hypothetical protein